MPPWSGDGLPRPWPPDRQRTLRTARFPGDPQATISHVAARNNLALSLALIGQFSEALEIITPMAKSLNATSRVRQNLALIYGLMGDRSRAEAVSRLDLDAPATASNLRFFEQVRGTSG